jgi:hypothetical protein
VASLLLLVLVMLARRSRPDTAGDFRRQIDALSSESRRSVVDQVHGLEDEDESSSEPPEPIEQLEQSEAGEPERTDGP